MELPMIGLNWKKSLVIAGAALAVAAAVPAMSDAKTQYAQVIPPDGMVLPTTVAKPLKVSAAKKVSLHKKTKHKGKKHKKTAAKKHTA
jgi:hypothetical protein